jgi:hypothetical protein
MNSLRGWRCGWPAGRAVQLDRLAPLPCSPRRSFGPDTNPLPLQGAFFPPGITGMIGRRRKNWKRPASSGAPLNTGSTRWTRARPLSLGWSSHNTYGPPGWVLRSIKLRTTMEPEASQELERRRAATGGRACVRADLVLAPKKATLKRAIWRLIRFVEWPNRLSPRRMAGGVWQRHAGD